MYEVRKTFEFAGAHSLDLNYGSPCNQLHGHNWLVTVCCSSEKLDKNGMVIDFTTIKDLWDREVKPHLDHKNLNRMTWGTTPLPAATAEHIAEWIYMKFVVCGIPCNRVEVRESRDNLAIYTAT